MSLVITINRAQQLTDNLEETVVAIENVTIEGETASAETRIYSTESDVTGFLKYKIIHTQKYAIEGNLWGRNFSFILRRFNISVFKRTNSAYAITIGKAKGDFSRHAFKRLEPRTQVKCFPLEVDLIQAIGRIIASSSGITVNSGWFSNLGMPNLNNVLLQGDDVNRSADWERFRQTHGALLSNVELIVEDEDFPNGFTKISLSKRGYLFSHKNLTEAKSLEITERILNVIFPTQTNCSISITG